MECKLKLKSYNIFGTLENENTATEQRKNKIMVLIRTHLCDELKKYFMIILDPANLWKCLESRYNRQAEVILPKVRDD